MPELIVVGEVLVTERNANNPLRQQSPYAVLYQFRRPPVRE